MGDNNKIPLNSLGIIIKEARQKKKWRTVDLAWQINNPKITEKTVKDWEKGMKFPDLDMMYKLAEILELNPNELLRLRNKIQEDSYSKPNWSARRIGDKMLGVAKPGYQFVSFLSKVILAIILVLVYKYIHALYEATDNPVVLDTQQILGNYLYVDNENTQIKNEEYYGK